MLFGATGGLDKITGEKDKEGGDSNGTAGLDNQSGDSNEGENESTEDIVDPPTKGAALIEKPLTDANTGASAAILTG